MADATPESWDALVTDARHEHKPDWLDPDVFDPDMARHRLVGIDLTLRSEGPIPPGAARIRPGDRVRVTIERKSESRP